MYVDDRADPRKLNSCYIHIKSSTSGYTFTPANRINLLTAVCQGSDALLGRLFVEVRIAYALTLCVKQRFLPSTWMIGPILGRLAAWARRGACAHSPGRPARSRRSYLAPDGRDSQQYYFSSILPTSQDDRFKMTVLECIIARDNSLVCFKHVHSKRKSPHRNLVQKSSASTLSYGQSPN